MTPQSKRTRGTITLAIGLPGAGKSTYFARRGIHPLSSDLLRLWLLDDETNQQYQHWVFLALRYLLRMRLMLRRPRNYVDATNLTPRERRPYFLLAARYGYRVHALFFDVPLETCVERNRKRSRHVPLSVMEQMAARLIPPARGEGFTRITVVRLAAQKAASPLPRYAK
jgi:predicted kinase